jgi:allophanate hydrolase
VPPKALEARAAELEAKSPAELPLYGVPFAIKDNIDLAGRPTTAACPDFAYTPKASAPVVQRLIDAGAIAIGKTNLDQFATGLVGTRSPYGAPANAFDPRYISGGSSSGSAIAKRIAAISSW